MSSTCPPRAAASSLAAAIWVGWLRRPKNCVVQLPLTRLWMPLGAWVAKIIPSPYLRACDTSEMVLWRQGVAISDGAKFCASSIT